MRQGQASRDGMYGGKVEPKPKVVSVKAVSQIGSSLGNHATDDGYALPKGMISEPLYPGKVGFLSPRDRTVQVFKSGSQGGSD